MRLTDLALQRLPHPQKGQKTYRDDVVPGFGLRVGTRSKTFVVMYGAQRRLKTIGKYPDVSLSDARREAKRFLAIQGDKKRSRAFPDARWVYLDECLERIRPATIQQYTRCLHLLDFKADVSEITRADLTPYLRVPHATISFKTFFNWCIRNDLIDRNPLVGERVTIPKARTRVLTPKEIKMVWHYNDPPFSDILKLLILTGQRRGEITAIQPEWITDVLTIPASVTKNKHEHIIPYGQLTKQYLHPYSFNGWSKSKARLDKVIQIPHWTIHDIRRSYATIHASIGTPIHITEKLLNHVSGTHAGIVGVYQRHAYMGEMKHAVSTYEDYISKITAV